MADQIATAVLHCSLNEPQKIIDVSIKVRDGLFANAGLYATPPITLIIFSAQLQKAITAQGNAKGGGVQATLHRDTEVKKLFTMLNPALITYVNGLYKGNGESLKASGFDVLLVTEPHAIPAQPAIDRIENGPVQHSAKVFLAKDEGPLNTKRERLTYIVQLSDDENEANFHTVLTTHNKHQLIIENLTRAKEVFIRVAENNAHGTSPFSAAIGFVAQ